MGIGKFFKKLHNELHLKRSHRPTHMVAKAWKKYAWSKLSGDRGSSVNSYANSAGSVYGPTGSIVGRY